MKWADEDYDSSRAPMPKCYPLIGWNQFKGMTMLFHAIRQQMYLMLN